MRVALRWPALPWRAIPPLCPRGTRRIASERGSALVEFSLVLPIVASLMLGVVSGGTAYHRKITMTDAVREGARFGATSDKTSSWATGVRDRTVQLSTGELTNDNVCVQLVRAGSIETVVVSWYPASGGGSCPASFGSAPPTPVIPDGYCVVKVWSHRTSKFEAVFVNRTVNLTARAVAAYERGATPGVC